MGMKEDRYEKNTVSKRKQRDIKKGRGGFRIYSLYTVRVYSKEV